MKNDQGQPPTEIFSELETFGVAASDGRRSFLKTLGLGAAASLAACTRMPVKEAIPFLIPAEEVTPGVATLYASTCLACPSACGLMTTVRDGRPVKLEGDSSHPVSKGGLCALGQGELRGLYDPGRLNGPTLGGRAAKWDAVDVHVLEQLEKVRTSGKGTIVLTPPLVSPTERKAAEKFAERFGARLVEHDLSISEKPAVTSAYATIDGHPSRVSYDLSKVDVWVSLGSDLLGAGPDPVANTAAWAERRRASDERGLLRHVQIEGSLSLTGAGADERWPTTNVERRKIALWMLREVAQKTHHADSAATAATLGNIEAPAEPERATALAGELLAAKGHALVTSGSGDSADQIAVAMINRLLGCEGSTLRLDRAASADQAAFKSLLDDLEGGRIGGLITVHSDPVGLLPKGLAFGEAMKSLDLSVAIDDRPTATVKAARVVAAAHHSLEEWSDRQVRPGVRTLAQPAMRPLFNTRPAFENFLHWGMEAETDWRLYLEATWRGTARTDLANLASGWAVLWQKTVKSAGLATADSFLTAEAAEAAPADDASSPAALAALGRAAAAANGTATGLELELIEEVGVRDGSRAHIPWLRELPDPLTRSAWTACARIAPERAREFGVENGDVVRLETESGTATLPVIVQPGQHRDVIAVAVGYGLAGGDPAEWNAYRMRPSGDATLTGTSTAVGLNPTGARFALPLMQIESSPHGRPIVHQLTSLDDHVKGPHIPDASLWAEEPHSSPHWEMIIDLDACTGCSGCVVACQAENNIPVVGPENMAKHRDMHWLRMDRYFVGDEDHPDVLFEPMLCSQCDNAPCETVCPVAATVHSQDGLNQQIYNRCVGTRYCANNCPYKVRRFNWFDNTPIDPIERLVLNPDVVVRSRGVMEKCTFCVQRIQASRIDARKEGNETFSPATACQQSCPAQAIHFGDATDPNGTIAALKKRNNAFQVLAEIGVKPSITYLARIRNRDDGGASTDGHGDAHHEEKS